MFVKALLIIDTGPGFKNDQAREKWNAYAEESAQAIAEHGLDTTASPERLCLVSTVPMASG